MGGGGGGAVGPDARNGLELSIGEVLHLSRVVGDAKVKIGLARKEKHLGADRLKRPREVAAVKRVVADVAVIPGERLRIEIGGAARRKALDPIGAQESVEIGRAERLAMEIGAVEILAQAPARVDMREGLERELGLA